MKYEWKKQEKELYGLWDKPHKVTIPRQNYLTIRGKGNPNQADFSERIGVLYSLAYPLKMHFKSLCKQDKEKWMEKNYTDYTVYPLEGIWTSLNASDPLDKASFVYTLMIHQPECITKEMFEKIRLVVEKKKPHPLLGEVAFDSMEDGACIQMLHQGSFDNEPHSFEKMNSFAKTNGLERLNSYHREIYLNDARKTAPKKRKTILRFQVKEIRCAD